MICYWVAVLTLMDKAIVIAAIAVEVVAFDQKGVNGEPDGEVQR